MDAIAVAWESRWNLARALRLKTRLIGINNRNLKTLKTDLQTTEDLAAGVPHVEDHVARVELLLDDARGERLQVLVAQTFDIVDDDKFALVTEQRRRRTSFEAEAEDADAPSSEVSEASGPEHG